MDDPLLVGVPDDERTIAAFEDLLHHDDLAGALEAAGRDDVHRLVEHDLLAVAQVGDRHLWRDGNPQLAPAGEDIDGAVLESLQEHAVAARRLRQPVDLLLERDHLVAGLAQRIGQPVVAVAEVRLPAPAPRRDVPRGRECAGEIRRLLRAAARLPAPGKPCGAVGRVRIRHRGRASAGRSAARLALEPCGHLPLLCVRENSPYTGKATGAAIYAACGVRHVRPSPAATCVPARGPSRL